MNTKNKMCFGVGLPSIIVIFVTLCLTTLGALSLMTASADNKLAEKAADYSTAYYAALGEAQEWLAQEDAALQAGKAPETSRNFPLSDQQALSVTLQVTENHCSIQSQKLIITQEWDYDEYSPQYGDIIVP